VQYAAEHAGGATATVPDGDVPPEAGEQAQEFAQKGLGA
jgi:hypothetical protein